MGNYCSTGIACNEPLLKVTVINLPRNSPPLMELKVSSPFLQPFRLIAALSHMNPIQAYTAHY